MKTFKELFIEEGLELKDSETLGFYNTLPYGKVEVARKSNGKYYYFSRSNGGWMPIAAGKIGTPVTEGISEGISDYQLSKKIEKYLEDEFSMGGENVSAKNEKNQIVVTIDCFENDDAERLEDQIIKERNSSEFKGVYVKYTIKNNIVTIYFNQDILKKI